LTVGEVHKGHAVHRLVAGHTATHWYHTTF